ncbi:1-acyl-sn-glycerol-3-phosphate acyltransferase [Capsulimonas corticalis]|uniref:1-acyl-sn-glycerol-3-phosphate acyltransferase n=1 Tax=Capsulimonas corticalis TaxID=2219043 RepID=A0A402CPK0_9BACT|nr:lysophospholipid acyltransferase family protein [Capsulimonas corticalis]BDI32897.1 1-acyl-sn-glycerol-3-phosphate acyltransferase [Capsulimonas corticalis]
MIYFLFYPIFFVVLRTLIRVLGRLRSSGEHHVPRTGGLIYCPNHTSDADPPTMFVTLPRRAWFIGKSELFEAPVFGWFFHHFHAFPIKRDSADRAALRRAEACLKRGEPIIIFPEGRCAQQGKLLRLQPGAAMLAVRAGAPIVPIGIRHTNEMLPYGSQRPRFSKHPVTVTFGAPIDPAKFADLPRGKAIEAITYELGLALAALTDQAPPPVDAPRERRPKRASSDAPVALHEDQIPDEAAAS